MRLGKGNGVPGVSAIRQTSNPVLALPFIGCVPGIGDLITQASAPATKWDTMLSTCKVSNALWKALAGTEDVPELLMLSLLVKLHRLDPERGSHFSKETQQISSTRHTACEPLASPGLLDRDPGFQLRLAVRIPERSFLEPVSPSVNRA